MSNSFATPWTIAHQASLSMGFPRQEYQNGCYFLLQGIFLIQGLNPRPLHLLHWTDRFFTTEPHFADKDPYSQNYGFSNHHVWVWELDHKEGWALENWCFWSMVLEKTLESPLDSKEIKPVHPKGNQPWIFLGRTDAEAEAAILWLLDAKSQLIGKDLDAEKDWSQKEKGKAENEMVR